MIYNQPVGATASQNTAPAKKTEMLKFELGLQISLIHLCDYLLQESSPIDEPGELSVSIYECNEW